MTRPDDPSADELIAHYHEASSQDSRRPAASVREAVLAHARMVTAASESQASAPDPARAAAPANASRWKLSLLASVALAALSGLLVLQFDRGTPEEQDAAYGERRPSMEAAPPLPVAPAPAPAKPSAKLQAQSKTAAPAEPDAETRRNKSTERRTSASPQAPAAEAAPSAAITDVAPAREQADALSVPAAPMASRSIAAPAAAPAPAPSARRADDATSLRSAAPAQQQEAAKGAEARESRALQAPRARLVPGSPEAALAIALQEAARTGRITQLDSLLRQGAPLNTPDDAGRTPLALAVIHGQLAAVQRLLAAGANTALVDRDGLTALQHARRLGLNQIAASIEAAT